MRKVWMTFVLLAVVAVLATAGPRAQDAGQGDKYVPSWRTRWTYEGEPHWSDLDPLYADCSGKEQSPIAIEKTEKADLPALRFEFKSSPLKYVANNSYTFRVNYHDAPGTGNFLIVGEKRYQLQQFHFHHPAEEPIHGKRYDMVLHFMFNADDGEIAGVAVLLKSGSANAAIQQVWEHAPKTEGQENVTGVVFNPGGMMPSDTAAYYTYVGSLTAPPCTRTVWFILKTPLDISAEQIKKFAELWPNDDRPLKPLNGRVVKESQ